MNFVTDFANPLSVIVISEMLGVEQNDYTMVKSPADASPESFERLYTEQLQARLELEAYFRQVIELPEIDRSPNPHIVFGFGIHFCLGAMVSRIEVQIALDITTRRLHGIRLACCPCPDSERFLFRTSSPSDRICSRERIIKNFTRVYLEGHSSCIIKKI
ncbi:hypothetical protein [Paenibacillus tyrfis]|uniref:hypothetical protein n=1 Tax=Paenibacillus tyrfis TaxID=1501230 RepID=UPI000B588D50|nr:hypothetical protein [Paenibacillus tyrfis]